LPFIPLTLLQSKRPSVGCLAGSSRRLDVRQFSTYERFLSRRCRILRRSASRSNGGWHPSTRRRFIRRLAARHRAARRCSARRRFARRHCTRRRAARPSSDRPRCLAAQLGTDCRASLGHARRLRTDRRGRPGRARRLGTDCRGSELLMLSYNHLSGR
jgi:hypothetical protein